jgi:alpha,alpha-trehalase
VDAAAVSTIASPGLKKLGDGKRGQAPQEVATLPEEAEVFLDDLFLRLGAIHRQGDQKDLVDMRLKRSASDVRLAMYSQRDLLETDLSAWTSFMEWGFEQDQAISMAESSSTTLPVGFRENLYSRWDSLTATFPPAQSTSRIHVPNPVVVPGGRFNESYYWDTYWIIEGLVRSGKSGLARGMVENFATLIRQFGFVPNGTRIYYLTRSQPPMLSEMILAILATATPKPPTDLEKAFSPMVDPLPGNKKVKAIAREALNVAGNDLPWLAELMPSLDAEYEWWMKHRAVKLPNGRTLNVYGAEVDTPRPESYGHDVAQGIRYRDTIAATESGWDFSSRWIAEDAPSSDLQFLDTTNVVPVDLNCILFRMEVNLAAWHAALGNLGQSLKYTRAARDRASAMESMRMNDLISQTESFKDLNRQTGALRRQPYASDFWPMWAGLLTDDRSVRGLLDSGLMCEAGVQCSTVASGQQWDAPNVWAPLQHILVLGLRRVGTELANCTAVDIADRFTNAVADEWQASGHLHEKYDASGKIGKGGEYEPQVGFGWTNGVCLHFLDIYGPDLQCNDACNLPLD